MYTYLRFVIIHLRIDVFVYLFYCYLHIHTQRHTHTRTHISIPSKYPTTYGFVLMVAQSEVLNKSPTQSGFGALDGLSLHFGARGAWSGFGNLGLQT